MQVLLVMEAAAKISMNVTSVLISVILMPHVPTTMVVIHVAVTMDTAVMVSIAKILMNVLSTPMTVI